MGRRNWQLIRDLETAKKAGRTAEEVERLALRVEESQKACPHPKEEIQTAKAVENTQTKSFAIKKGDEIVWCLACSFVLKHTNAPIKNRKSAT